MEPVYYGHLGVSKKWPDYQGVLIFQVILYEKVPFGTSTEYLDYAGASVHINRFHCTRIATWAQMYIIIILFAHYYTAT